MQLQKIGFLKEKIVVAKNNLMQKSINARNFVKKTFSTLNSHWIDAGHYEYAGFGGIGIDGGVINEGKLNKLVVQEVEYLKHPQGLIVFQRISNPSRKMENIFVAGRAVMPKSIQRDGLSVIRVRPIFPFRFNKVKNFVSEQTGLHSSKIHVFGETALINKKN